jgi:hypothetical protein
LGPRHLVENARQLQQRIERDARRPLIHSGTDHRIAHPARQLAQSPRLVLDQDDIEAPAAGAFTQPKPSTEQRMPSIFDRHQYRFVCGMTCVLVA